jgi:enoyl-CoA hydratase/carnithine racemase
MVDDLIKLERRASHAFLKLNRPSKLNALNTGMWQHMLALIEQAAADDTIRALIVCGDGKAFAAGADIAEMKAVVSDPALPSKIASLTYEVQRALNRFSKPTIAMIRGPCIGGGCGIALCCDIRIADDTARFGITPAKLGLVYSLSDTKRLVDAVGVSVAKDILFTGRIMLAEEALSIGLINYLWKPELLEENVIKFVESITSNSQTSMRANKRVLQMILDGASDDNELTRGLFLDAFSSNDFAEGLSAFNEKRKPKFTC